MGMLGRSDNNIDYVQFSRWVVPQQPLYLHSPSESTDWGLNEYEQQPLKQLTGNGKLMNRTDTLAV